VPVGCLNDSLAFKRIAEVFALRMLPRRSIFDMPGCELPRINDGKIRFLWKGTKIVHTSFVRNYRDLVVVVTSGKWLKSHQRHDILLFRSLFDSNCVISFPYLRQWGHVFIFFALFFMKSMMIFCLSGFCYISIFLSNIFTYIIYYIIIKLLLSFDISEINKARVKLKFTVE